MHNVVTLVGNVSRTPELRHTNDNGEKRSKATVVADDVGPSLRWATCTVARIERDGPSDRPAPSTAMPSGEEPF